MSDYVHKLELGGSNVTLTWVGKMGVEPARVYALAFTPDGKVLLVSGGPDDPDRWLPGGGVHFGETPEEAILRELLEEADAKIEAIEYLGSQRLDNPPISPEYHNFYWCRVSLSLQSEPRSESTLRHLVLPADFLDTLQWGRTDPKAPMLFDLALQAKERHSS